jgi:methylmalonyl-CoA mutase
MNFPPVTFAQWRGLVEKELAGKPFDRTLVHEALRGIAIEPLYADAPPPDPASRLVRSEPFRICMRHEADATAEELLAEVTCGADALWVPVEVATTGALSAEPHAGTFVIIEAGDVPSVESLTGLERGLHPASRWAVCADPVAWRAAGRASFASLSFDLEGLGRLALAMRERAPRIPTVIVSSLPYHDAGADVADELAIALATGACYLEALLGAGLSADDAREAIAFRIAVGRDTFVELCKLRALRTCWEKVLVASGATGTGAGPGRPLVHAVCSSPALSVRDPWVNMLRVTTQVFAAVMGGAELVTPSAFDQAFGASSALGRRVARNTGLVLREESALGKVSDPTGGSFYFDTLTDAIAREAWTRFRDLSREGGIVAALETGRLAVRLESTWKARLERIATRKLPILGVSEFANPSEKLPHALPRIDEPALGRDALAAHRDAACFEALRFRAESIDPLPEVLLVTLGSFAESRPRVGFSANFFSAGGLHTRESATDEDAIVACLCGTDERYASEAAERAKALKARGVRRVIVAGRPKAIEPSLREAGVDAFLFVGCDAVAFLSETLATYLAVVEESR